MIRVTNARVDAHIPGWLTGASASHAAVTHARRVVHALSADPDRYGFDPGATYTVFVQGWDRGELNIRSIAFGRNVAGHEAVSLWPDPYYIASRGFRNVHGHADAAPAWSARSQRFVWRGSVTGAGGFAAPEDIPRIRLALACLDQADSDVGLIGIHSTMRNLIPYEDTQCFIRDHGLERDSWQVADFANHRFAFDIDGHANAWGLLEKLILGCCVLKVASPFEQWYYSRMKPWVHYVPVSADLTDLPQIVDWCRRNDAQCEWIAANGARLARSLELEYDLGHHCQAFLSAAHVSRSAATLPKGRREPDVIALEDAAARAEAEGLINTATDTCTQIVDRGKAGASTLRDRSRLYMQQGRIAEALRDLEDAVATSPEDAESRLALAHILGILIRDAAAVDCLNEALRREPTLDAARIELAASCIRLDRLDQAFWLVDHLPESLPGWWADLRRKAREFYQMRRDQARTMLRRRPRASELTAGQAWELAIPLYALGRLRLAARLCAMTATHNHSSFAPHEIASKIIARREGSVAALAYVDALAGSFDGTGPYCIRRAQLLFELGEYRQVLDLLRGRLDIADDFGVRRMIAHSSILLEDHATLLDHCGTWMERTPDELRPAELVCSAQPLPGHASPVGSANGAFEIAQFWHDEDIPADVRTVMDSWSVHHPGVCHHVFDDESGRAFLAAEGEDDIVEAYDMCRDAATRASLLRYAWLHRRGGVWISADQRCLRPAADVLWACASAEIGAVRSGRLDTPLHDAIVGARRGSSVAAAALGMMVAQVIGADKTGGAGDSAVRRGVLTRVVARHLCDREAAGDVALFAPLQARRFAVAVRRL